MFLLFAFAVLVLFLLANIYIYKRVIKKFLIFKYFHKFFLFIFILLFIAQVVFFLSKKSDFLNPELYKILALVYAPSYCLFFMTLGLDLARLFMFILNKSVNKYLKILLELIFVALAALFIYSSIHNALRIPPVKNVDIKIQNLKENLKIALLTDVHLGKNLNEDFLNELIKKINDQNVDLVAIAGDLIDTDPKNLSYISKLNYLRSKYGTYYVPGNHEYYHDLTKILNLLKEKTNIKILLNQNIEFENFNLAGLSDLAGLNIGINAPNPQQITTKLNTTKPSILLSHQPKSVLMYDLSDFDLILSGHTHAGQIFPFMFLVKLQQGFVSGLYALTEKNFLYVSSGAGFWGPALRVLAPNELSILNLKAK